MYMHLFYLFYTIAKVVINARGDFAIAVTALAVEMGSVGEKPNICLGIVGVGGPLLLVHCVFD